MDEEKLARLLHEASCGPVKWEGSETVSWSDDHEEWDRATAKALLLLLSAEGYTIVEEP